MKKIMIVIALLLAVPVALAAISTVTGACVDAGSAADLDLTQGSIESDTELQIFAEQQAVVLGAVLDIDVGSIDPIPAGTPVNSYIVHFDPVGEPTAGINLSGSVTLDRPVVGLIYTDATLGPSDSVVGNAAAYEPAIEANHREIEGADTATIVGNTVSMNLSSSWAIDEVRIIELEPVIVTTSRSGPDSVDVMTAQCWTITICVDAWAGVTDVVVQGGIGADLNVTEVTVDEVTYYPTYPMTKKTSQTLGAVTLTKRGGKMGATIVTWDVGAMAAEDAAECIELVVCTGLNPKDKQEFTTGDVDQELDGGFSAEYMLGETELKSPETDPLTVYVNPEPPDVD